MAVEKGDMVAERDSEGYLVDPDAWNEDLAVELAREEGIELGDEHWLVIRYIRDYASDYGIVPDIRHAARYLAGRLDCGKKEGKRRIFELFPYGYVKQACKIAGMRRPRAWSTG